MHGPAIPLRCVHRSWWATELVGHLSASAHSGQVLAPASLRPRSVPERDRAPRVMHCLSCRAHTSERHSPLCARTPRAPPLCAAGAARAAGTRPSARRAALGCLTPAETGAHGC